jgi:hypothetical protein
LHIKHIQELFSNKFILKQLKEEEKEIKKTISKLLIENIISLEIKHLIMYN